MIVTIKNSIIIEVIEVKCRQTEEFQLYKA